MAPVSLFRLGEVGIQRRGSGGPVHPHSRQRPEPARQLDIPAGCTDLGEFVADFKSFGLPLQEEQFRLKRFEKVRWER